MPDSPKLVVNPKEVGRKDIPKKDTHPDIEGQDVGWAILECLTLDPVTHRIPLIVCSAAIRELQAHAELLDQYGIEVLTKPFDLDTLLAKVASALERGTRRHEHGRP